MGRKAITQLVLAMLTGFNVAGPLILDAQSVSPTWPWQYHALIGFVGFIAVIGWIIYDKQRKINELEDSYGYALSFDGLSAIPVGEMVEICLNFTNTLKKPIEYIVEKFNLEIGGNRPSDYQYKNRGQVIPSEKSVFFQLPALKKPNNIPCKGFLRFELVYGPPGKPMFQHRREMELTLRTSSQGTHDLLWQFTRQEDTPLKK